MTIRERLTDLAVAVVLLVLCLPAAAILTLVTSPLWEWVERAFRIEAYGHSGPAEWCYLAVYGLLVTVCGFVWLRMRRSRSLLDE